MLRYLEDQKGFEKFLKRGFPGQLVLEPTPATLLPAVTLRPSPSPAPSDEAAGDGAATSGVAAEELEERAIQRALAVARRERLLAERTEAIEARAAELNQEKQEDAEAKKAAKRKINEPIKEGIGFKLLKAMGWKEGEALGGGEGLVEPLKPNGVVGKRGLAAKEEKQQQEADAKIAKAEMNAADGEPAAKRRALDGSELAPIAFVGAGSQFTADGSAKDTNE